MYGTAIIVAESEQHLKSQQTPQSSGELWVVCFEDFGENWPHYKGIALYIKPKPRIIRKSIVLVGIQYIP